MIKDFQLYGERCSGTNYFHGVFQILTKLPGKETYIKRYGWKHFFFAQQYMDTIKQEGDEVLFIGLVRDPYDWLHSMFNKQYHLPENNRKNMKNFLLNQYWSTHRVQPNDKPETEIMEDRNLNGKRFKNIFEARKYKCEYLLYELPKIAKNSHFVNYTNWLRNTKEETQKICQRFNLEFYPNRTLPKQRDTTCRNMLPEIKKIIDTHLNWDLENAMGFFKRED